MRNIRFTLAAVLPALLLIAAVSVQAAGVSNISLTPVGTTGVSGTATTIVGDVAGTNPYHNVEVNIQMSQAPASGMVYQGWMIDSKDNYKLSLGAFNGNRLSFRQKMAASLDTMPYDSIAVSVEPASSVSVQPTTIVAQGSLPGTAVSAADFPTAAVLPVDESFQQQAITTAFNITKDQYNSLRMMGWGPADIALIGNVASKCKKSPMDVADMLSQGQTWDQVASTCNTTTAMLFQPVPFQAVAGSMQETGPMGAPSAMGTPTHVPGMTMSPSGTPIITVLPTYQRYSNGRPVITRQDWIFFRNGGYSWEDVATAANIAAITGETPEFLLRETTVRGLTWEQIAGDRGINYNRIADISGWPFSRTGVEEFPQAEQPGMEGSESGVAGTGGTGEAPPPSSSEY